DAFGNAIAGAPVAFTVVGGGTGAAASFPPGPPIRTNALGIATAPVLTANGVTGSFTVTASVPGQFTTFTLTNIHTPTSIAVSRRDGQDTPIGSAFARLFQAVVRDVNNLPVANVAVTFTAPDAGPSGAFVASSTVRTNDQGIATAPSFIANYVVSPVD